VSRTTWCQLESETGEIFARDPDRRFSKQRAFFPLARERAVKFKTMEAAKDCARKLFASDRRDLPKFIYVAQYSVVVNRNTPYVYVNPRNTKKETFQ